MSAQQEIAKKVDVITPVEPQEIAEKVDVIIPVGPDESDIKKTLPLSLFLPRSLFLIGGKPMLWHILNQLCLIKHRINNIYLLVKKLDSEDTWHLLKDYDKIFNFSKFQGNLNIKDPIVSSKSLIEQVIDVLDKLETRFFMFHLPDEIFPVKQVHREVTQDSLIQLLNSHIDSYTKGGDQSGLIGTLWGSSTHSLPIGVIEYIEYTQDQCVIAKCVTAFFEKQSFHLKPDVRRVPDQTSQAQPPYEYSVNTGVSIFTKDKLKKLLRKKKGNDFYMELSDVIQDSRVMRGQNLLVPHNCQYNCFQYHHYDGTRFHVDNLHDLQYINSVYSKYFD